MNAFALEITTTKNIKYYKISPVTTFVFLFNT